jgi:hypothetical protein
MLAFQCLSSVLYNSHPGFYYAALVIAVIWHGRIWEGYKTDTPEGRREYHYFGLNVLLYLTLKH